MTTIHRLRVAVLCALLCAALASPLPAFAEAKKAAPASFRGLNWGAHAKDIPHLQPATLAEVNETQQNPLVEVPGSAYYTRADENPVVGDARLERIIYCFYNDRLFAAHVLFDVSQHSGYILSVLRTKYGEPDVSVPEEIWEWDEYSILKRNLITKGVVSYYYKPILQEFTTAQEKQRDEIQKQETARLIEAGKGL